MKIIIISILCLMCFQNAECFEIDQRRGIWIGADATKHHCHMSLQLGKAIVKLLEDTGSTSIADFGCGLGEYTHFFMEQGFQSLGCDGNPNTLELTDGLCEIRDLSQSFDLGKKFDWVMSLEVGEHIPQEFEDVFIDNLVYHCKKGIILSWAHKGQKGTGHFNCQNDDYIKEKMAERGLINDLKWQEFLRARVGRMRWLIPNLMVFIKSETQQ